MPAEGHAPAGSAKGAHQPPADAACAAGNQYCFHANVPPNTCANIVEGARCFVKKGGPMDVDRIRALLGRGLPLRCLGSIDSTNTMAKQWARQGVPHGAAVLADRQTAGRGRLGRSFFSPEGGLYMSLIVDSVGIPPGQLTTLAAVAVLRAAEQVTGRQLHIKWVNDLLLDGRKVCGILTEGIVQGD
ncbi:MAG: biotin--[acetyl-CoA-carboxylase] ligase, partial [Clostridiales bacterium]|nr:biotin--[acetyl-CoA-carboxylase] ligase [Clostridiales bacterium]